MKKKIVSMLLIVALLFGNVSMPVQAASLRLKYDGRVVTYTGKQIKIQVNGTNKSINKSPGILMGAAGYAMLPYYETFVTSKLKMKRSYIKSSKKLTLTYNADTLTMTVGKNTAIFNGTTITLPMAPVSVKYQSTGITRILVPSRKIAELFGLNYMWNSASSTVVISSNNTSIPDSITSPSYYYKGQKKYKVNRRNVSYSGAGIDLSATPALLISGYNYIPYKNAWVTNGPKLTSKYVSSKKTLTIANTLDGNKNILVMKINSKKATLNGKAVTLAKAPMSIKFSKKGTSYIYIPAKPVAALLGLSYSYASSTKTMDFTSGFSIKYKGAYTAYTRTKVSVQASGKMVSSDMPGILEENSALIPAKATFNAAYGLGVSYSYKNNAVTLKKDNITITTKVNSKTATVNGTNKTMPVATRLITLVSSGSNYVMIPGEFICQALGLEYYYSDGISHISKKLKDTTETAPGNSAGNDDSSDNFRATITLARPAAVSIGSITCTDDYNNKKMIITMPGDQTAFYRENSPVLPSDVTMSTSYSSGTGKTNLTFTTTVINGFRVKEDNQYIYIMNGKPTEVFKNVIVLDAGHGGSDSGATGHGYREKDFTLGIVLAAKVFFDNNSDYKVYYTRTTDVYPSLSARYELANGVEADLFISVHINSADSVTATGTETLYNPDRNKVSAAGLSCYQVASITHKHVLASTGLKNRGLKERCTRLKNGLAVLNYNNGPATLTEIGFISNQTEAKQMAANLKNYGTAIYNAVVEASTTYPTKR